MAEDKKEVSVEEKALQLEQATKKLQEERLKLETLKADKLLSGHAEAGVPTPKVSSEQKLKEEIQAWFPRDLLPISLQ